MYTLSFLFVLFLLFPSRVFAASQSGLLLWFHQVLPALLPFSILSAVLLETISFSGKSANLFILICGICFGFPIGSKLSADFYQKKIISQRDAQLLCAVGNNISPAFITSYALDQCLHAPHLSKITFLLLYAPPICIGLCGLLFHAQPHKGTPSATYKKTASSFQLNMKIFDAGIISSFETLIRLCGYIVLFSILSSFTSHALGSSHSWSLLLTGMLEVTTGMAALSTSTYDFATRYILAIAFLSFGGISGIAQTNSMIANHGLSIAKYIKLKLLCMSCSVLAALLLILFFL